MSRLLVIIKREYLTRAKSKGFVIGTILTPVMIALLLVVPALMASKVSHTDYQLIVLDQSENSRIYHRAEELLKADNESLDRFQVRRESVGQAYFETRRRELNNLIGEGRLNAYVVIPVPVLDEGKITYHAKNIGDFLTETRIENAFNTAVIEERLKQSGIDVERMNQLSKKLVMEKFNERGESQGAGKIILAFVLMGVLCLTVLAYGSHVMSAVIEEKQSRIIEVLVSSVKPFTLMLGKLLGVGLVGLTQYAVWAVFAVALSSLAAYQSPLSASLKLPPISVSLMIFFVIYFLLGYFLYATLYAMVGGVVSNEEDGQQMQFPLMALILLAPVAVSFVWRNPDSAAAAIISIFPFFSPFAMVLRIAIEQPPWWQIALSILLLVATIIGAIWLTAKFYRVGALMYGKRPTLAELARWLNYN